jgi:CDP-glucose 4,6-dehydratase
MVMESNFWGGKKVFITGHTGFKGSWLTLWLHHLGANITGYALNATTTPNLFDLANIDGLIDSIQGNVKNFLSLGEAVRIAQPEIIFHLAAQPLVRHSYKDPLDTYETNVIGTLNLFEAARSSSSVKVIVNVTTDKCYENREWVWGYREIDPMGGLDPYSSSKACSEILSAAYRASYFSDTSVEINNVALATARAGNVIGGGDWSIDRLVPDVLDAFSKGAIPNIRNPSSIRPWQHVLDPLYGYMALAQRLYQSGRKFSGAWNFGPEDNEAKSVGWIAHRFSEHFGVKNYKNEDAQAKGSDLNKHHEAKNLKLDISKAKAELKWSPRISLEETIKMTFDWDQLRRSGKDVRSITLSQIKDYQERIN